jgi:TRAP-type C4-dicarboxylate transport system permease large subunit
MMVITLPIVFPLIQSLGFDGIWFGIIVTKVVEIGLITPPLGLNVYIVKGASPVPLKLEEIFRGVSWFIFADLITLTLLIIFPDIALVLPNFLD